MSESESIKVIADPTANRGERKKDMTIEKIIEKLENECDRQMKKGRESNGVSNVVKEWYKEIRDCDKYDKLEESYNKIFGMLYGLYGTYFITETELAETIKELFGIWKETQEKILTPGKEKAYNIS